MPILELSFASAESSLSVRKFSVHESLSNLFTVSIEARSPNDDIELESIVGKPAMFRVVSGAAWAHSDTRSWTGIVSEMELTRVEPQGLSTYELKIVPSLWMLTQRQNNRLFQHQSVPEIAQKLLDEWRIPHAFRMGKDQHPKLELRVQYGESDYAFFSRLLEEAGITFYFEDNLIDGSRLVLNDRPQGNEPRHSPPIPFLDDPTMAKAAERDYLTEVRIGNKVRPGRLTIRDFDFRRPGFALFGESPVHTGVESKLEQYHYVPGAFVTEGHAGGETPAADDKGIARHHHAGGHKLAQQRLEGHRATKQLVHFETNAMDLSPGVVFTIGGHPRKDLADDRELLVNSLAFEGAVGEEWTLRGAASFAALPYRPAHTAPKPRIYGVQSAVVVGPPGEKVHTDEFGRIRVQFHWDREGRFDENSSVWLRVSQAWAGPGYGMINLPRVGHEVLVGFLEGDPDNPIVVGRVFNGAQQVPYKLPDAKLMSAWKTDSNSNIILFVDIPEHEGFMEQAEKDRLGVVKNDQLDIIGHDLTHIIRADESNVVGGDYARGVLGNYSVLSGGHISLTARTVLSQSAGLELSTSSGYKWQAGVTPLLPFITANLGVRIVKSKIDAAFPAGPPDLMAILQAQAAELGLNLQPGELPPGASVVAALPASAKDNFNQLLSDFEGLFAGVLAPIFQALGELTPAELQQLSSSLANAPDLETAEALLNGVLPPPPPGGTNFSDFIQHLTDLFNTLIASLPDLNPAPGGSASAQASEIPGKILGKALLALKLFQAVIGKVSPGTGISIKPHEIHITTGKASFEMKGADITIKAKGSITIEGESVSISPSPCKCG